MAYGCVYNAIIVLYPRVFAHDFITLKKVEACKLIFSSNAQQNKGKFSEVKFEQVTREPALENLRETKMSHQ